MAARHGCDNQYGRKSSVFNHHKTCQFNVAKVSARSGHRFVTVVEFVNDTDVMGELAKLRPGVAAKTRAIMGIC